MSKEDPEQVEIIWVIFTNKEVRKFYRFGHRQYRRNKCLHKDSMPIFPIKRRDTIKLGNVQYQRKQFAINLAYSIREWFTEIIYLILNLTEREVGLCRLVSSLFKSKSKHYDPSLEGEEYFYLSLSELENKLPEEHCIKFFEASMQAQRTRYKLFMGSFLKSHTGSFSTR